MKNIIIILTISFYICIFQSCDLKNDQRQFIAGKKFKLWKILEGSPTNSKATYYYYFENNGGFKIYERGYYSNRIISYQRGDVVYEHTWKLKNDTLAIAGLNYKILQSSSDTLKVYNNTYKEVLMVYSTEKFSED